MEARGRRATPGAQRVAHTLAEVRRVALASWDAGFCPVPARPDGSKAPIGEWRGYQKERPPRQQVESWHGPYTGIGLICGNVSSNLECLEFDDPASYTAYKELAASTDVGGLVERIEAGYLEQSPSGGIHWLYLCAEISGNTKLARCNVEGNLVKVLIETRGEGGYVIIAPSYGKVHPSGKPYVLLRGSIRSIATITPEERESLFELARSFDLMPKPRTESGPSQDTSAPGDRPGDDFNSRAHWKNILEPHGWRLVYQKSGVGYWRRPGKAQGVSATTNWQGSDLLYVFSTSTPFESERGYSKFAAYAQLAHGGDFKAAANALAKQGYGQPRQHQRKGHHRPRSITTWEVRG